MSQRYIGGLIYNPPGGWSGQFGATSTDMLSTTSSAAFAFGTGDFTMEAFVFATASQTDNWIIGLANNCWLRIGASGVLEFYNGVTSSSIAAASAMPLNQWIHVAAVRSGTTLTIYQNGVSIASGTVSTNFSTSVACTVGNQSGYDRRWNGYISNVRVVKGTAVYTTAFTPPNGPLQNITNTSLLTCRYPTFVDGSNNAFTLTVSSSASVSTQNPFPLTTLPNPAQGGAGNGIFSMSQYQSLKQQNLWPTVDPYFDYTTLLLHGNGTNGGQNNTFLDSGTANSGSGFTITRNGNTTQGTFSPFSQTGWSNNFNGSNNYLSIANNAALKFGTGDFTVEAWIFPTSFASVGTFVGMGNYTSAGNMYEVRVLTTGKVNFGYGYVSNWNQITGNTTLNIGNWYHVAVARTGTTINLFVNGVLDATVSSSMNFDSTYSVYVGANNQGTFGFGNYFAGYVSNVRLVKGTAVYTAAFTPPTLPLTAISGTSLLTCQSNRFVDNSSNAFAITATNSPSVQAFSPFAPTAAYSASTVGGSGYFDGSGDYLTGPNNAAFNFSTGDFCIEFWVYPSDLTFRIYLSSADNTTTQIGYDPGNGPRYLYFYNGAAVFTGQTAGFLANQWNHVALCRSGTTLSMYCNGTRAYTNASYSSNVGFTTPYIGEYNALGLPMLGYISNLRMVKGASVYTPSSSTLTVPTAPLTAISNTSLLLNFTNAAIIDNTAKNVLETVGNAQISTSVSKFGGASLAFDGNGDYLFTPSSDNFVFNGDFTIEFWVYRAGSSAGGSGNYEALVATYNGSTGYGVWWLNTTNVLHTRVEGTTADTTTALSNSTWYHVAVTRSGSTVRTFVNGVQGSSLTSSSTAANPGLYIGAQTINKNFNGYIDDLRITKGIARYTSNFTPQTSQWQDQ